ncbi:MAG TPA: 3-phosphoshikimate 1-carboxyvinyltransferase [Thermoanaerobaculia bacterium]|nr:3-phosphoshikimate 1-carboxyvinyltransferase [Thermoanaerobaculia bacterium]
MTASSSISNEPRLIPAGRTAGGRLRVPSSKSLTHRYLLLALLSGKPWTIVRPLLAEDTRLTLAAVESCGVRVEQAEEGDEEVRLLPGQPAAEAGAETEILCGNAGTLLRFLVAVLAVLPGRWRLDGVPRLRERPVGPLVDALRPLGARLESLEREGYIPLRIDGGSLRGGTTRLDAGESSQYLSALLMAGLRAPEPLTVEVASLVSEPYVDITLAVAAEFGGRIDAPGEGRFQVWPSELRSGRAEVEGDWSSAAYPAAAAALTGGEVVLAGLRPDSPQGDRGFLDILAAMGAEVEWREGGVAVRGRGRLRGIEADLSGLPDQVPTLAALAPFARGETLIHSVAHLRIKESDRLAAMAAELQRLGAEVEEGPDFLRIRGTWADGPAPADPVTVETYGDHRIAMSLAVTGLRRPGVAIAAPEVVSKSYPGFWDDLDRLLRS